MRFLRAREAQLVSRFEQEIAQGMRDSEFGKGDARARASVIVAGLEARELGGRSPGLRWPEEAAAPGRCGALHGSIGPVRLGRERFCAERARFKPRPQA